MDWLITALSALRELRDYRSIRRGTGSVGSNGAESAPEAPAEQSIEVNIPPIGPALDTSRVSKSQPRGNGAAQRQAHKRREPPRGPPPARADAQLQADVPRPSGATDLPHDLIDRDALDVLRRLKRAGHTAYLVGGCVRDLSLGLIPKDFDIATSAKPEEIRAVFRNCRIIGRRFRLAHIYFRGGKIIETATFRAQTGPAEVEEEGEAQPDLLIRHDNVFGTAEEDARRRDFTINGLFYDPAVGKIIDFVGGIADLQTRTVRMIGNPDIRLREDPVRVLRAVRIAAKTDTTIDPELLAAIRRHKGDVARCSKPRVLEETMRLFRTGQAEKSLKLLDETGVLDVVLPNLRSYLDTARREGDLAGEDRLMGLVRALDDRAARGPVSDTVVMATLIQGPLDAMLASTEPHHRTSAATRFMVESSVEIGATRKMSERLRQIVSAQRFFEKSGPGRRPRRKVAAASLISRAYFAEALDLFEIISIAQGEGLDEVELWRGRLREAGDQALSEDEPESEGGGGRRKRRRRRGGARPRSESPAPTELA